MTLIIVIIAIALGVLMSIISMNYLDESGNNAAKAEAARVLQEASQIRGAILIARNDGMLLSEDDRLTVLVPLYLSDVPRGAEDWTIGTNHVYKTGVNDTVCLEANWSMNLFFKESDPYVRVADDGKSYIPYCHNPDLAPHIPCCDNSLNVAPSTP